MPDAVSNISSLTDSANTAENTGHCDSKLEPSDRYSERLEYIEAHASSAEWVRENLIPSKEAVAQYVKDTFPFTTWIYRYNWMWFLGDLISGITVSVVVIPQGMAYAKLAQLPPNFGMYSSFLGPILYFFFGTSKDITVGPVAVMSTLMGHILDSTLVKLPQYQEAPWVIACGFTVILGCIVTGMGLLRLGFIVDFIPLPSIAAFMTGSALSIAMGQIPTLMGNNKAEGYNTRDSTYLVFGNFFKYIGHCDIDAALGLSSLFFLYFIRWGCGVAVKRWPKYQRIFFFADTLRTSFVFLLYTFISFLVNHSRKDDPRFSILGFVPRGFKDAAVPKLSSEFLSVISGKIPSAVIVLIIEHISISKSFGRVNKYTINPNQELIAIGISNIFSPFIGGYASTGSFSRTAVNSKAGVRTPFGGVITGIVVLIAIYALPPVLFYIPNPVLSAVIIHAVGNLITGPSALKSFWRISPFEFIIFWIGVIVSVFTSIDDGIYATVAASAALMLFRIAKARGKFLGSIIIFNKGKNENEGLSEPRSAYVPLDNSDGINPSVKPAAPPRGIFVYQLNEGYLYPNAFHFTDHMIREIMMKSRPGVLNPYGSLGNRPWNDPGPRHKIDSDIDPNLPELNAIVLDFSGVSNVDITSVQNLIDVRKQLDRHANTSVPWHFSGIKSPWIKRALIAGGFGTSDSDTQHVFTVANVGVPQYSERSSPETYSADDEGMAGNEKYQIFDEDKSPNNVPDSKLSIECAVVPLLGTNLPYFHIDLDEAIKAANTY